MLAAGDPSLSLALSMHAGVLAFWRESDPHHENPQFADWEAQKRLVFHSALNGAWWGTITSEPGTGGNIANTRMAARRDGSALGGWRVTGEKHFGSGSSVASYMITTAVPEGEAEPSWFFLPIGGAPWDGSAGLTLRGEWDGHGMAATDSHAFAFCDFPATRFAWPGHWRQVIEHPGGSHTMLMVGVIVGIIDAAMNHVRAQLRGRGTAPEALPAFEKVEWVAAQREAWLLRQTYDGGLRGAGTARPRQAGRWNGQAERRAPRRVHHDAPLPSVRRRGLLAPFATRPLVRGRTRARLHPPALVHRPRCPARHMLGSGWPLYRGLTTPRAAVALGSYRGCQGRSDP